MRNLGVHLALVSFRCGSNWARCGHSRRPRSIPEEPPRVHGAVRHRGKLSSVSGTPSLAAWLRLPPLRGHQGRACRTQPDVLRIQFAADLSPGRHGAALGTGPPARLVSTMWRARTQKAGRSAKGLQRPSGLRSCKTAWLLLQKLRSAWSESLANAWRALRRLPRPTREGRKRASGDASS